MTKKTYMAPATEIFSDTTAASLLQSSLPTLSDEGYDEGSENLSREFDAQDWPF